MENGWSRPLRPLPTAAAAPSGDGGLGVGDTVLHIKLTSLR